MSESPEGTFDMKSVSYISQLQMDQVRFDRWDWSTFPKTQSETKAQELSTTHIKSTVSFASGLCFNVHLDSMHPAKVKLFCMKTASFRRLKSVLNLDALHFFASRQRLLDVLFLNWA